MNICKIFLANFSRELICDIELELCNINDGEVLLFVDSHILLVDTIFILK
jgi:hypothetical protein